MSKYNDIKPFTLKDYITRAITLIASVLLIVYFLPHESSFGYDFGLNKPWKYGQLIASFDFPVYKSNASVRHERDSVMKLFQPYFDEKESVATRQIENLRRDFYGKKIQGVPLSYLPHLVQTLRAIYVAGVADGESLAMLNDSSITAIRCVLGNRSVSRQVANVYSIRTAYEQMVQADSLNFKREIIRRCDINNYIEPNLVYDKEKSDAFQTDLLATISYASGLVQSGQKIVDRGDIVNANTFSILESLERESIKRNDPNDGFRLVLLGQMAFVTMLILLFTFYLNLFRRDYYDTPNTIYLMSSLIVVFPVITSLMVVHNLFSVYMVPYAIVPIFVRIFMDSRTAFFAHVVTILICSITLQSPYEFILVQFVAGLVAIYSLKELTLRSQLLRTAVVVTFVSIMMGGAYDLMQGYDFSTIDTSWYGYVVVNGVLLLFVYPLMYLVEKLFGFTSSVTLIELSNINNELMRRMSKEAQGTFNHSMQVANLATEVANKIGAKVQLVRTGALYHDIGKISNPAFFTENQTGVNPHDSISEERSAQIIINHVTEGLKLAEKHHLPKVIREFIATHHGRGKAKFFYISYVNNHPDEPVNEENFTYPGPNPFTREQAILMMTDSVEAASRSLKEISEEHIRDLVEHIINEQMSAGAFRECPITFRDIDIAKKVLVENLKTIYHTRISYPELKKAESRETEETEETDKIGYTTLFGGHKRK
ncbi:MAG: HDIG domain-containing protein [Bacteroidaceae bacterium]